MVVRTDGSFTGDQLRSDGFGAIHDLTHFVVEQTLGLDCGFFGLIELGWNIRDFDNKANTPSIPDEAIVIECLVGQLTNLVIRGPAVGVEDFNWLVAEAVAGVRPNSVAPQLSDEIFAELCNRLADLLGQWKALPAGESVELEFSAVATKNLAC